MRKIVLILNGIVIVFFIGFLAYTFFASAHLNYLAKNYAIEVTVQHANPLVDKAEEAQESKLLKTLLPKEQEETIEKKIAKYRENPTAYVADLTEREIRMESSANSNPMLQKVLNLNAKIREFYDDTITALITDLRIFSTCNLIAALIAFAMASVKSVKVSIPLLCFSIIIFASVLGCSYIYIDDLSFFAILFQSYMGWSYGALLIFMIIWVFFESGFGIWCDVRESLAKEAEQ